MHKSRMKNSRRDASSRQPRSPYLKIEMKPVIITSVSANGAGADGNVSEPVTLNFGQYTVTYVPQDNDGSALPEVGPIGWNMQTNEVI